MNKVIFIVILGFLFLSACSENESPAAKQNTEVVNKNDALMGYKHSLDTAKSITSMAEENEKKKNQAIQDLD